MNYSKFVAALAKPLPTRDQRIKHAFLGLIGELGELADVWKKHTIYGKDLDRNNVIEELGDLRFYIQMIENEGIDLRFFQYPEKTRSDLGTLIYEASINIGYFVNLYSNHPRSSESIDVLANIINIWKSMCTTTGLIPQTIINRNMKKLNKRYPDKVFKEKHAIERLDKNEEKNHIHIESEQ